MTNLHDTWKKLLAFNRKYFPKWRATKEIYYSNALAGEVGEICNAVKHRDGGGTHKTQVTNDKLLEECADVFIYLHMLVEKLGCNNERFAEVINKKIQKNILRVESQK